MSDTIEARVERGAKLLDERLPGWDWRIDLGDLDLGSSCNCIIGQEFGTDASADLMGRGPFSIGAEELFGAGVTEDDLALYGFEVVRSTPDDRYEALTAEWRRLILARREQAAAEAGEGQ